MEESLIYSDISFEKAFAYQSIRVKIGSNLI